MVKRALTPGTFDPITSGHMDVITRASRIMDEVIVAVAASDKKHPLFDLDERVSLVKQAVSHIPNVRVEPFDELLVDFARRMDAEVVIKGLRAITDFEYEFQMTAMNYQLDQELETTFIMSPPQYMYLSSSIVRDTILRMGGTPMPERSGHAFIKKRFLDNGAAVAGEVSGHFFFGELGYDDGLFAALFMAQLIAQGGRTLGEMAGEIVCPPITPDIRVFCPYAEQQSWLDRVEAAARAQGAAISHLDGVRADFPDCWFLIRKSVTAQQITLRAEARTQARLDALLAEIAQQLPEAARAALRE